MTTRRAVLVTLGTTLLGLSRGGRAQPATKVPHIGYLSRETEQERGAMLTALKAGLRDLGYIDGKNIAIDVRWAGSDASTLPELAASLVQTNPAAIIGTCIPSTRAAKKATRTIPVVMSIDGDPVEAGLVSSFARPGGNVTGTSTLFDELIPKWLELLNAAVPKVRHFGFLSYDNPYFWAQLEGAAQRIGVKTSGIEIHSLADLDRAFDAMPKQGAGALVVMTDPFMAGHIAHIVALADRYQLPAIYGFREFAEAGGLMSYGLSFRDYFKRVARYIDLVLKGANPADLPVEQASKIELVINLATARKLGVTLPAHLLARAEGLIG